MITPCPISLPDAARLQAVLLTSGQAIPMLPPSLHRLLLLGVGDATAARARAAGFLDVVSAHGDATALAALTRQTCQPAKGPLLLACGARQGTALATDLRASGFKVIRRTLYKATPATHLPATVNAALTAGTVRSVLFFSAETARSFARLLPTALIGTLAGIDALTIASSVAAAIQHLPWRTVRVALRPTEKDLLALL